MYDALRSIPAVSNVAEAGVLRAAGLIALRQRRLGMVDEGYLALAGDAAASLSSAAGTDSVALEVIDAMAPRLAGRDAGAARPRPSAADRARWLDVLRAHADEDALSSAVWVWFSCTSNPDRVQREPDALLAPLARFRDAPVVAFHLAICSGKDDGALEALESANARFLDVEYPLALRDIGARQLDAAETRLTKALDWHADWPAALTRLANIELTAEDFAGALALYERALALVPEDAAAMVGRIEALSFLLRHEEAIARSTELLQTPNLPGDAYYWRAWNENHLDRLDVAWEDVEHAERLWHNSNVLMLAGIVAYRRRDLDAAKTRFSDVLAIEPGSCDATFYLASVHADLSAWDASADGFAASDVCYDRARSQLAAEIERLRESGGAPERVARQVARREAERATALRLQIQCWFNGAVASVRLGRRDDARRLAAKVVDDEQFGERARQILAGLQ